MNLSTQNIILALLGLLTALAGGAWITKKVSNSKKSANRQSDIRISGDSNKVVGGDDNSKQS